VTCRTLNRQFHGGYELTLLDGARLPLSRRCRDNEFEKPGIG